MTFDGKGGKMHNAATLADKIGMKKINNILMSPIIGRTIYLLHFRRKHADFITKFYKDKDFIRLYNMYSNSNVGYDSVYKALKKEEENKPSISKSISWVITKNNNLEIGVISLVDIDIKNKKSEIIIGIPNALYRRGNAAVQAMLLIMNFAFTKLNLNKITSLVYDYNK